MPKNDVMQNVVQVVRPRLSDLPRPQFSSRVSAGFPSPADDYVEGELDLNRHLIKHPAATFFVRVSGDSMIGAGIHSGDLLVVDRAVEPTTGKIVVAIVDAEMTVKRLQKRDGRPFLMAENDAYAPIAITEDNDVEVWGVVTAVIHEL
ncbi:MAG: translesion error-prone DNA polymerase V autoproteolytic subunit [Deltaproteobacteria bacterium]|nr:translesion error-prone DNA polymerase V autoproteolytic subunit [Deltaproteobacteria bacterium]